jgi:hypothetical protein
MDAVIYMPLVGEGTDCWRSVRARRISEDIFEVMEKHIPSDESWKFAPSSRVRCRNRIFTDGEVGLEAFEYAIESDPNYQLLKKHEKGIFRVAFKAGEEAVVRVASVSGEYEDLFMTFCPLTVAANIIGFEAMPPIAQNLPIWCPHNWKRDNRPQWLLTSVVDLV